MIQVVLGKRGSGKSKRLIDLANEALKTEQGLVVFVDDDKNNMYDRSGSMWHANSYVPRSSHPCCGRFWV